MVGSLLYLIRAATALLVLVLGLGLLVVAATAKNSTGWGVALAAAVTVAGALAWPRSPDAWRRDKPTDRQLAFAKDLGIAIPRGISKGELSDLISEAKAVRDAF